jgi:hypothetical protein
MLDPNIRTYLDAMILFRPRILLADCIIRMTKQFNLTPEQAGKAIASHIRLTVNDGGGK